METSEYSVGTAMTLDTDAESNIVAPLIVSLAAADVLSVTVRLVRATLRYAY